MIRVSRHGLRLSARLLLLTALGAGLSLALRHPGAAEDPPATVTSDTAEWCASMAEVVARHMHQTEHPPPRAAVLAQEGSRMCKQGRIRPGIYRLRRAWILLVQPSAEEPD